VTEQGDGRRLLCSWLRSEATAKQPAPTGAEWSSALGLAKSWQVLPLLYRPLRDAGGPVEAVNEVLAAYRLVVTHSVSLEAGLRGVLKEFERGQISVAVLKGGARFVVPLWGIEGRPMADIDLLIRPADVERVGKLLDGLGYVEQQGLETEEEWMPGTNRHHMEPRVGQRGLVPVEVHWGLASEPHPFSVTPEQLWGQTRAVPGFYARVLSPEAQVLHVALHASWSNAYGGGMTWLVDLRRYFEVREPAISGERLVELAQAWGMCSAAYWPLWMARREVGAGVPESVVTRLRPGVARRVWGRWLLRRLGVLGESEKRPGSGRVWRALYRQVLVDGKLGLLQRMGLFVGHVLPGFRPVDPKQSAWSGLVRGLRHYGRRGAKKGWERP